MRFRFGNLLHIKMSRHHRSLLEHMSTIFQSVIKLGETRRTRKELSDKIKPNRNFDVPLNDYTLRRLQSSIKLIQSNEIFLYHGAKVLIQTLNLPIMLFL